MKNRKEKRGGGGGEREEEKEHRLTLYDFVREVVENKILAVFGDTRSGKTTFCTVVALECAESGGKVLYIDTEGNLPTRLEHDNVEYVEVDTAQELQNLIERLVKTREDAPNLLIIDSLSMPVLREDATAVGFAERGMVQKRLIALVSELKKFCKKHNATTIVVMHPISTMTLTRILESVAKRLEQASGKKRRVTIEELPEEIKLMYMKPVGGKALFDIKEIWLTYAEYRGKLQDLVNMGNVEPEVVEKLRDLVDSLDIPVTKTVLYASESRRFPKLEKLASIYITGSAIIYKIHIEPKPWKQPKILSA